jgi:hypothetical protein
MMWSQLKICDADCREQKRDTRRQEVEPKLGPTSQEEKKLCFFNRLNLPFLREG